jgi:hypothetical protein
MSNDEIRVKHADLVPNVGPKDTVSGRGKRLREKLSSCHLDTTTADLRVAALPLEKVMTKEKTQGDELTAIGKQTMARAYSAMDYYFDHLKKTVASAPSGGTEFGEKVKACAEHNITATQEFVRELSYAKDIQDMLRIQTEFMRSQLEAFGEQAKDLSEAYIKAASGQARKRPVRVMHVPLLRTRPWQRTR